MKLTITNPTGGKIRSDSHGDGHFGSSRGSGSRIHQGIDFETSKGDPVKFPFDEGQVIREARPYRSDNKYSGALIRGTVNGVRMEAKLFYIELVKPVKILFKRGEVFAKAQAISEKYGKDMQDHVHMQVKANYNYENQLDTKK